MSASVTLSDIAVLLGHDLNIHLEISNVYHNSNDVTQGSIFVAIAGEKLHGAKFIDSAVANGANAIVTDSRGAELANTSLPILVVENPRRALAEIAFAIYGPKIKDLHLYGITGTNGKTTTSHFLRALLPQPAVAIGTTGVVYANHREELSRTTPEIDDLYRLFVNLRDEGIRDVVMEVSSHALVLERVTGLQFQSVGFTNLTTDHLDFHGTFENYHEAKSRLFQKNFSKYAVVCVDSNQGKAMADLAEENGLVVSTVSAENSAGTWYATGLEVTNNSIQCTVQPLGISLTLSVGGSFNVSNALIAIAMADQIAEVSDNQIKSLAAVRVPGRMQQISVNGLNAIVDYAHSPDAVAKVVSEVRKNTPGKLIVVIGAGGNRDQDKRPLMGAAAAIADLVVVTDDNPRNENPDQIRSMVIAGISSAGGHYDEIPDRRAAIEYAASLVSSPTDCVLVLGKGHEMGQQIGDVVKPFDDSLELERALAERGLS